MPTSMKQPEKRGSRQATSAREVLDKENLGQMNIRVDKSLRRQYDLCCKFQHTSMNAESVKFIEGYVKKHYPKAMKAVENLEKQAVRRNK